MNRAARSRMASDTLEILETGRYAVPGGPEVDISDALHESVGNTRQYVPEDLQRIYERALAEPSPRLDTAIAVVNETTLAGASHLSRAFPDRRVGVLNFASAKKPGGGFLGGSHAQEESLACSSGLYASLIDCPEHYRYHRYNRCLLYSHRIIYTPGCPVFRNDSGDLLSDPYLVDFFTCAAPNAGAVRRNQPEDVPKIVPVLRERVRLLLGLAVHLGVVDLVLGAWGAGVFRNDPESVAEAFEDALDGVDLFSGRFRTVRFSVLDRTRAASNYQAFADAFGEGS